MEDKIISSANLERELIGENEDMLVHFLSAGGVFNFGYIQPDNPVLTIEDHYEVHFAGFLYDDFRKNPVFVAGEDSVDAAVLWKSLVEIATMKSPLEVIARIGVDDDVYLKEIVGVKFNQRTYGKYFSYSHLL